MNKLYIQDRETHEITQRQITAEGFMRVPGRVAKTGTQQYLRKELGLDGNPNETVTVYRPPEEVFHADSLATYHLADITLTHPMELVNAKNYKSVVAGVTDGAGRQDGDFVVADLIVKDGATIKAIEAGTVELSAGYTAEYFDEKGVAPDGTPYDYVQRDIRINHVALVPSARAGRQARLFDNNPKEKTMKTVVLDSGRTVEIQDEAVAHLVTDAIERLTKTAGEAKADSDRKQAKIDALEEEATKKKSETADSVIAERLAQITEVKDRAKEIEASYVADSIDPVAIMRGVLATTRATVDWSAKSDEYVRASFDLAHENAKAGVSAKSEAQRRQIAADAASGVTQTTDAKQTPHQAYAARFITPKAGA